MALLEFFKSRKKSTANLAKERLQIIVAERRNADSSIPSYLPKLKRELLEVIKRYVDIAPEQVQVNLEQNESDLSVLELNVTLPDGEEQS